MMIFSLKVTLSVERSSEVEEDEVEGRSCWSGSYSSMNSMFWRIIIFGGGAIKLLRLRTAGDTFESFSPSVTCLKHFFSVNGRLKMFTFASVLVLVDHEEDYNNNDRQQDHYYNQSNFPILQGITSNLMIIVSREVI